MIRMHRAVTITIALAGLVLAPSIAGAFGGAIAFPPAAPGAPAFFWGNYFVPANAPPVGPFPAVAWNIFFPVGSGTLPKVVPAGAPVLFTVIAPGFGGNGAAYWGSHPAPGVVNFGVWAWGAAAAKANKALGTTAASPDTVHDSLLVSVDRSVPGQVTISISGVAQHMNPGADDSGRPVSSVLGVAVYPDSNSAKNRTGALSQGTMKFTGSAGTAFTGIFNAGDFTAPTTIGDGNDFQVATNGSIVKVVAVPNAATACVEGFADPDANAAVPGSTPITLLALAALLLVGGTWFLLRKQRPQVA
jgi:hypothetical protein